MKINEVEKQLKVSRANIRFYEKEGLFAPERGLNGYRSYSDNDVKKLKTILMFRKMGFSVSAIRSLMSGNESLGSALNENIEQIKKQIDELSGALSLCNELKRKDIEFSDIDIDYYWSKIERKEQTGTKFADIARDLTMINGKYLLRERKTEMNKFKPVELTVKNLLMFVIPAAIGALLYLIPMTINGKSGMLIGLMLSDASTIASGWSMQAAIILMTVTAIATLICNATKPDFVMNSPRLKKILVPGWTEAIIRIVGSVLALVVWFKLISEVIYSEDTGMVMLELVANIMIWFVVASLFVPFLLDFGLMEFIGTLCRGIARPLLHIPGRSMVDVLTSFLGDQNLGIMVTNDQYVQGYYTTREATTIACCFSATGIAYWYIISSIIGIEEYFIPIVVTMFATALVTAFIMCRIPPITFFPNTYYNDQCENIEMDKPEDMGTFEFAVQLAVQKASTFNGFKSMLWRAVDFSSSIIFSVLPVVMIIGSFGLILATYTPLFDWIGLPFGAYMDLLGIPEAAEAAPATVAGFADVMIPSLLCGDITSELTKFIICVLSLIQIIYMSEVGPVLLMSEIPVKFRHLVILFVEKTILAIPIIYIFGLLFKIPA